MRKIKYIEWRIGLRIICTRLNKGIQSNKGWYLLESKKVLRAIREALRHERRILCISCYILQRGCLACSRSVQWAVGLMRRHLPISTIGSIASVMALALMIWQAGWFSSPPDSVEPQPTLTVTPPPKPKSMPTPINPEPTPTATATPIGDVAIVAELNVPLENINGIAWDGAHLWTVTNSGDMFKMNTSIQSHK